MCELLIELYRELESGRSAICPAVSDLGAWLPIKRRVDFDRVEMFGVERELVETFRTTARGRVENPVPCAGTGRIVPARRADA
jgi:hypothetical protein